MCGYRADNADPAFIDHLMRVYIYLDDGEDIYLFGNRSFQFSNVLSFVQLRQILFLRSNFRNKEIAAYSCAINLRFCQILGLVPKISNSAK